MLTHRMSDSLLSCLLCLYVLPLLSAVHTLRVYPAINHLAAVLKSTQEKHELTSRFLKAVVILANQSPAENTSFACGILQQLGRCLKTAKCYGKIVILVGLFRSF